MGSSRRSAVAGLAAALLMFVGCMGILVTGSAGQQPGALLQTTDSNEVNNVIPHDAVREGDRVVQFAISR